MPKFSALIAVVAVLLVAPAPAGAYPATAITATQITSPAATTYPTFDFDQPAPFDISGTATGDGDVDIRCYSGSKSALLAGPIPVSGGTFQAAIALDHTTLQTLGYPHPFCTLRAVPAGTTPVAPPGSNSEWAGPALGVGQHRAFRLGPGSDPNPTDQLWDYYISRAQSRAMNDYDSASSCGLCDTFLFSSVTGEASNAIWYANAGLFDQPRQVNRTAVNVDSKPAYASASAYWNFGAFDLRANPGFPQLSYTHAVDAATGDVTIEEHVRWVHCAPDANTMPPTDTSCTSYVDAGVQLDRLIKQSDAGLRVAIVDRWKSIDGQPHSLDAMYEDTAHSENSAILGHEGRADFTWTGDGFKAYHASTDIPAPQSAPATLLIKTDASVAVEGDEKNPFGAMVYGSKPSEMTVFGLGAQFDNTGRWHSRYERAIPAGGEVVIGVAYVHDYSLDSVRAKAQAAEPYLASLMAPQDPPVDGAADPAASPGGDAAPPPSDSSNPTPPAAVAPALAPEPVHCVVPKLRGKTLTAARRLLERAHCSLGRVIRKPSAKVKPGRVLATPLKPGSRVRAGTRIRVTVARKL